MTQTTFQCHCRPLLSVLYWGHCNCVEFKLFWMHSDLCTPQLKHCLYLLESLFFPSISPPSAAIKWKATKRLLHNSRSRGWGPHLGYPASLIPVFYFTPCCGNNIKKTLPTSECQQCLIFLLWHKKDSGVSGSKWVWLEGMGVTSVSRSWNKTLMWVLLSRGWPSGEIFLLSSHSLLVYLFICLFHLPFSEIISCQLLDNFYSENSFSQTLSHILTQIRNLEFIIRDLIREWT